MYFSETRWSMGETHSKRMFRIRTSQRVYIQIETRSSQNQFQIRMLYFRLSAKLNNSWTDSVNKINKIHLSVKDDLRLSVDCIRFLSGAKGTWRQRNIPKWGIKERNTKKIWIRKKRHSVKLCFWHLLCIRCIVESNADVTYMRNLLLYSIWRKRERERVEGMKRERQTARHTDRDVERNRDRQSIGKKYCEEMSSK